MMRLVLAALAAMWTAAPAGAAGVGEAEFRGLRRDLETYRVIWPVAVDEALESFDGPVRLGFSCGEVPMPERDAGGRRVPDIEGGRRRLPAQKVLISVRTRLGPWLAGGAEENGLYEWNLSEGYEASGARKPGICANRLRLDPVYLHRRGEDALNKRIGSLVLLYHELLHGQLFIDAMREDAAWQRNYCDIFRSAKRQKALLSPADPDHLRIPALEEKFRAVLTRVVEGRASEGEDPWSPIPPELLR